MLIEMAVKGLLIDPATNTPIVLLRDPSNERVLPIWVGPVEANAIALQIENITTPRPMTHDLLRNMIEATGATLHRVVISELRESTFFAYLELRQNGETLFVDSRPSDALALALRTRAPIFVEERVLEHARPIDVPTDASERDRLQKWLESLDPDDLGYKM